MFQVYSAIFTTLDILRYICPYWGIFQQIQAYSEPMLIMAYSEAQTCLTSFWHVVQLLLKSHLGISEPYLGRFMHIQNFRLFRHVMFHAYSGKLTKVHSLLQLQRNIFLHLDIFQQIQAYSRSLHQFKPTLLRKSRSSFKSLEHFFIFASKVDIQQFALHDSIIVITIAIITTSTHVTTPLTPTTQARQ